MIDPERFRGRHASHGRYASEVRSGLLGGQSAEVTLRNRMPMDTEGEVEAFDEDLRVRLGQAVLAEDVPAPMDFDAVALVSADADCIRYRR